MTSAPKFELLLALGAALMSSGDERAARDAFDAAAARAREHNRIDDLARAAIAPGGFEVRMFDHHQIGLLHEALRGVGPEDSAFCAQLLARLAVAETFLVEPAQRREGSSEAIAIARRLDAPAVLGAALAAHLDIIAGPQYVTERLALAEELMELARSIGDRQLEALGLRFRVVALMEVGDLERVRAAVGAYEAVVEALGSPLHQWYVPLWRSALAVAEGNSAAADALLAHAAALGDQVGSMNTLMLVVSQRWERAAAAGDVADLDALWRTMNETDPAEGLEMPSVQALVVQHNALRGENVAAAHGLDRLARNRYAAFADDAEWLMSMVTLAYAVVIVGDTEQAVIIRELLLPYADLWAIAGIGAYIADSVHAPLGQLAAMLDKRDEAAEHFRAAYCGPRWCGERCTCRADARHRDGLRFDAGRPTPCESGCPAHECGRQ